MPVNRSGLAEHLTCMKSKKTWWLVGMTSPNTFWVTPEESVTLAQSDRSDWIGPYCFNHEAQAEADRLNIEIHGSTH